MGKKNRYGISVEFSCKLCTVSNFETVEDYIAHKKESHSTEFRKQNKCLIVLEEKTLPVPITYTYYYENQSAVDKADNLQVKNFDCHGKSPVSTTTVIKEEKDNDESDEEDPLSTKTTDDDLPTPSSCYDTGPGHIVNENQNLISSNSPGSSGPFMKDNDQPNFQCKLCLKTFYSEPQWKTHKNICGLYYKNQGSYCCALCNDLFSDTNALKYHLSTSHTKTISKTEESIKTENALSQYYSELEEAPVVDKPEEAAEYIIADNDSLQETPPSSPSPPSPKKMKPNYDPEPPRRGLRRPPKINRQLYPKPLFTYSSLIFLALKNSRTGNLRVGQMYKFISRYFPYFHSTNNSWKNSVRHNLSCNPRFEMAKKPPAAEMAKAAGSSNGVAQREKNSNHGWWAVKPEMITKMDHQVQIQLGRHVNAIRSSLKVPENLELMQRGELKGDFEDDSDFSDEDKEGEDLPANNHVSASASPQPQPSVSEPGRLRQRKQSYLGKTKSLNNSKSFRKSQGFPIGTHLSRFRTILPKVDPKSKSNDDLSRETSQDNSKTLKEDYIVPDHNIYEDEGDVSLETSSGRSRKQILDVAATRRFKVDSQDFSFLNESQFSPNAATRPRPNILTKKIIRVKAECQRPLMALMETSDFGFGKIVKVQGNYLCKPGK